MQAPVQHVGDVIASGSKTRRRAGQRNIFDIGFCRDIVANTRENRVDALVGVFIDYVTRCIDVKRVITCTTGHGVIPATAIQRVVSCQTA